MAANLVYSCSFSSSTAFSRLLLRILFSQRLDFDLSEDLKATAHKAAKEFDAVASSCDLKILQTQVRSPLSRVSRRPPRSRCRSRLLFTRRR